MVGGDSLPTAKVIDFPITALGFHQQMETILTWAKARDSRIVCVANVHMLMEAHWYPDFGQMLQRADMVTPDGMPLVWMMRVMGCHQQERVAGLDILAGVCELAQKKSVSVFFLGSQTEILSRMRTRLEQEYPNLKIAAMEPLPFRPLTIEEDAALVKKINDSGAGLVLVSLGCPKQEKWMGLHRGRVQAVMIGLGGAFPVYAGFQKRAPRLVRDLGLEWLYRWLQEPRRLWKRYTTTIPPFIFLALKQLLSSRLFSTPFRIRERYLGWKLE
ncbi:WecB/TagA/CpsF family glycosyltransferase [Calothrix sp. NIES-3974]|uniref:WecB/TagA/CpsF family glycosyltransferase n=1 Tax=Calothrix sp. NIES-3974 TaxID=2005462 RepID=UPI000B61F51B|nr:WecB/TagA/CpsF family glycosyltransferase [Calothrix sp. NIES-3974]BAZ06811.1 WecB/TagA/CpsF family glycosyl transferase [Calothrix sp. NIES-3974]